MWYFHGEEAFASGVGSVVVRFPGKNYIFVVDPLYWVPNNTTNNISPGAINLFSSFKSTLVDSLKKMVLFSIPARSYPMLTQLKIWTVWKSRLKTHLGPRIKPIKSNRCTYLPTITVVHHQGKHVRKTTTAMCIHHKFGYSSHKKSGYNRP